MQMVHRCGMLQPTGKLCLGQRYSSQLVALGLRKFIRQRVTLFLHIAQRLRHGQLARMLTRIQLGLECLDFKILGYPRLLHPAGSFSLRKLDGIALALFGQFKALMQLLLERAVADLLQDVGVASCTRPALMPGESRR